MLTAQRYVARQFLVLLVVTFISLLAFFSIFALAEFAREVSGSHREFSLALELTGINLGVLMAQVAPLSIVLSVFILGTTLSRRGELTALFSSGMSPIRLYTPLLALAGVYALGLFFVTDQVAPKAAINIDHIVLGQLGRWNQIESYFSGARHWFRVGDRLIRIGEIDQKESMYHGVTMLDVKDGRVARRTQAEKVLSTGDSFIGFDVMSERYAKDGSLAIERADERVLPLGGVLNAFMDMSSRPSKMPLDQLERVYKLRRRQGYNPSLHEGEYYGRLFFPSTVFGLVLVAISYAFQPDLKRSIIRAASECVGLVGAMFFIMQMFRSLALSRVVSPQMGAIGPLMLIFGFGLYRVWRQ